MALVKATGKVENMYTMTTVDLQLWLTSRGIPFDDFDNKHCLQARLALSTLGIVTRGQTPDDDLLVKVTGWCKLLVREQLEELAKKNLDIEGNKWDHVEVLIRAELETAVEKLARLSVAPESLPDIPPTDFAVVQLLVTSIYSEIARTNSTILLPKFQIDGKNGSALAQEVLLLLNNLPPLTNSGQLNKALKLESDSSELLKFICSSYGTNIIPATGDLLINGMPKSTQQFVLVKPCTALQNRFEARMAKLKVKKSIVLWHGTMMCFLRSIIVNGFAPTETDTRHGIGLFMGETPRTSYSYACGASGCYTGKFDPTPDGDNNTLVQSSRWLRTTLNNYGVLLGCEVSGDGQLTSDWEDGRVHVVTDIGRVMVRYIFLCPLNDEYQWTGQSHQSINPQMESAFKILHERYYDQPEENSS